MQIIFLLLNVQTVAILKIEMHFTVTYVHPEKKAKINTDMQRSWN